MSFSFSILLFLLTFRVKVNIIPQTKSYLNPLWIGHLDKCSRRRGEYTLSNTPECVIPAYELLQALYRPEQAAKIYKEMSQSEREKTDSILATLNSRKQAIPNCLNSVVEESLPHILAVDDCDASYNMCEYFKCLGYRVQSISASVSFGIDTPTLILEW